MPKKAVAIIEEQSGWVKDRLFHGTTAYLTGNLDSFPMTGMGFGFVRKSAETVLVERMEEALLPKLDRHLEAQIEFTKALVENGEDEVGKDFREELLDTDPLWDVLKPDDGFREEVREDIIDSNVEACSRAARWAEEADGETFSSYAELADFLGKDADEAVEELNDMMYYVELMEKYRDHIDATKYSSVLERERVHDWFLENLIEGLKLSEREVLEEVGEEIRES
ncbi:MAG: hypothetical protein SVQ76_02560 [Candidatus Nanohaloarchaea archaeon]|nr:hypothetical protein [Candidatus Nanohaloarchaea archaeon]